MNAKISISGINQRRDAMLLKEKLVQARREAAKAKHEALMRDKEKEVLVEAMDDKEANFMAQGMSRA